MDILNCRASAEMAHSQSRACPFPSRFRSIRTYNARFERSMYILNMYWTIWFLYTLFMNFDGEPFKKWIAVSNTFVLVCLPACVREKPLRPISTPPYLPFPVVWTHVKYGLWHTH